MSLKGILGLDNGAVPGVLVGICIHHNTLFNYAVTIYY